MRWIFCLSLLVCFALLLNACERQSPEVLKALPGAGHHEEVGHGDGQAEMGHGDTHAADVYATPKVSH